eukprot:1152617-Pelagomonas_calceolata.AAC.2
MFLKCCGLLPGSCKIVFWDLLSGPDHYMQRLAVSPEAFTAIMQQLEATDPSQRVDLLAKLVKVRVAVLYIFWAPEFK